MNATADTAPPGNDPERAGAVARDRVLGGLVVIVAAVVAAWVLVRTWHGPRITGDTAFYVSAAENLADGKGLITFRHQHLSLYAPGYSVLLAVPELLGISAREASRWLNAALFAGTILVAGLWLRTACRFRLPVVAAVLAMACAPVWHSIAAAYASDPLYLFVTVASLALLDRGLRAPARRDLWLVIAAGALAGASAATRYIGVVAIASSLGVIMLSAPRRRPPKARLLFAGCYGLIASLPVLVVLALNLRSGTGLMGERTTGFDTDQALQVTVELLARRFASPDFAVPWIMLLTAMLVHLAVRPQHSGQRIWQRSRGVSWPLRSLPFATFGVAYSAALVASGLLTSIEIETRYVLPAWVALLVVCCELLDRSLAGRLGHPPAAGPGRPPGGGPDVALSGGSGGPNRRLGFVLIPAAVATALFLASSAADNVESTVDALRLGMPAGEYSGTDAGIRDSDVFDLLEEHPVDGEIHTNRPHALYWLSGHQPVQGIPRRQGAECLEWFAARRPVNVVWFDHLRPHDQTRFVEALPRCDIAALHDQLQELELLQRSEDGAIYRADWAR